MSVNRAESRLLSGELFPTDEPVPSSQLIGRADELSELAVALAAGTNVVVAGPRRTGKTSLCDAALTRLAGRGLYVAAVDLFALADAAELAEALATAVLRNRPAARKVLSRARRMGRHALSAAQGATALTLKSQLGDGVELALTPGIAAENPQKALGDALELAQRVAVADGKRIVVFFDEFQEVANDRHPYGDPDVITKRMRAIFQRSDQVSFLFAGSLEHLMRRLFANPSGAFGGFGTFYALRPIGEADWTRGLRERFAADGCEVSGDAVQRLLELSEMHPRVTMLIAQQTHLLSVLLGTRRIDIDLVSQGYEQAYRGDSALLDQLIERIRLSHKLGLKMARRIALGQTLTGGVHAGEADRALKKLLAAGLIEKVARGDYAIQNPLLRRRLVEPQGGFGRLRS